MLDNVNKIIKPNDILSQFVRWLKINNYWKDWCYCKNHFSSNTFNHSIYNIFLNNERKIKNDPTWYYGFIESAPFEWTHLKEKYNSANKWEQIHVKWIYYAEHNLFFK